MRPIQGMGDCCISEEEKEQKRMNKRIDDILTKDKKKQRTELKLLLLGNFCVAF